MRSIGTLPEEEQARRFGDYLTAQGIRHELEAAVGTAWQVWVRDEDHLSAAQAALDRFRLNPAAEEFRQARVAAAQKREQENEAEEAYRRRLRTRNSLFPKLGGYGIGALTLILVVFCVAVAAYSKLGYDQEAIKPLLLADPDHANGTFLPEVRTGQIWRLITPIFIHFGPLHLIFNLLWLFQLGSMIEARLGTFLMFLLVLVTGAVPMIAQYLMIGPAYVGGMSGLIYGLAGFIWMRGKYDPTSGLFLNAQSIQWLLIWLVICLFGIVGRVANTAHFAGLIIGVIWGRVSAYFASRKMP